MAGIDAPDDGGPRRVLGIEGTAWAASAAVYDVGADRVAIETDAYEPDSGGIHPREAAEHMQERVPAVLADALGTAREWAGADPETGPDEPPVDAVAFSRGPGLGPCLRVVGTAARSVAQVLDVPLVGVNHMVAHLEVGRQRSGFDAPVCLNASGANAHLLAYNRGRYRVLGETMDTGVGNAIDKFTRHVGWSHPGGPKVEAAARDGEYVELPYVVKGMDFSFSGLSSAAKAAVDEGRPVADVCRGLEETVFAMLAEVSERALSLTGADELVLGGGVGQNDRLQGMLAAMCDERGADFFAPEDRFLRDNAGMIAVLGAAMAAAGDTVAVADSRVAPDARPDGVPVTWRDAGGRGAGGGPVEGGIDERHPQAETLAEEAREIRGAEAVVTITGDTVTKRRLPKGYRHPDLDAALRRRRTVMEARLTSEARRQGVPTPLVRDVDTQEATLVLQRVGAMDLARGLTAERVAAVGRHLAALHAAGFVHGDPTTRNARVGSVDERGRSASGNGPGDRGRGSSGDGPAPAGPDGPGTDRVFLIDFGLGYHTDDVEDFAMDLHVLAESLDGTAADPAAMREAAETAYAGAGDPAVIDQLREIEGRGRYR